MRGALLSTSRRRGLKTISYVGAGTAQYAAVGGDDLSVPYPGSLQADDFLWVVVSNSSANVMASNALSGFTRVFSSSDGGSSPSLSAFWKRATGSESGSITLVTPTGSAAATMFAYRGVNILNPFPVAEQLFTSATSVSAYDVPAQTPGVAGCTALLMAAGNIATGSWTPPANYTELWDGAGGTSVLTFAAHRLGLVATTTGVRGIVKVTTTRGLAYGAIIQPAAA